MKDGPIVISFWKLATLSLPILIVGFAYYRWCHQMSKVPVAALRMVSQLILVGFFLNFIFSNHSPIWVSILVMFMLSIAAWIAYGQRKTSPEIRLSHVWISLVIGCLPLLLLVGLFILDADPWYDPRIILPMAGMIFANGMNSLSLALERYWSHRSNGEAHEICRTKAFQASLIPILNTFISVGLVSLPGMMTGQILAGIEPLIAVRYQLMVMAMVFGSSGLTVIFYFLMVQKQNV